ncbi:RNA-directed DNA polymerase, eukaryota [Tanacetum coccineum]
MASNEVEIKQSTTELKHFGFLKEFTLKFLVVLSNVYDFAKENSGVVKTTLVSAENTIVSAIVPLYNKLKDLPEGILVFVDDKVNILAWKIKIEALPTRFNISRRGIDIDSILCPICECGVEFARHVFFSCSLVRQIVRKVCSWWDIMYINVNSYVEWVNWMNSLRLKSKSKLMIEGVFYVVWWHVWTFRNKLLFEDKKPLKAIIFDDVVSRSYYWCKFRCKVSFSWDD